MKVCILIPLFNERPHVFDLVRNLKLIGYDVLVVDDGSTDGSGEEAERAGAIVIRHPQNKGKGAALKTGFEYIRKRDWDAVVVMDGDGQHDWREVTKFLDAANKTDASIIIGTRMNDVADMPTIRFLTNYITSWMISRIARQRIEDAQCGYRLFKHHVLKELSRLNTSHYETESEILIRLARKGYKIVSLPVKTVYKGDEVSKIRPVRDTIRFFKLVLREISRTSQRTTFDDCKKQK